MSGDERHRRCHRRHRERLALFSCCPARGRHRLLHRCGGHAPHAGNKNRGPSVVMSEDVTRARGSNPAGVPPSGCFGRCAPCALAQGSLRRAVKFGDREDGLRVTTNRLVLQRAGPLRGATASRCTASNPFAEPFVPAPRRRAGPSGPARPGAVMTTGMDLLRCTVPTGSAAPSSAPTSPNFRT